MKTLVRQVRATIHEAACAAAALLDQDARKIALRFPAHMRMWLCRHLAVDTSGRLAQLAQACPGALIFAFALAKLGHRAGVGAAGAKLLRDAIAGRGLGESWTTLSPRGPQAPSGWPRTNARRAKDISSGSGSRTPEAASARLCCAHSAC